MKILSGEWGQNIDNIPNSYSTFIKDNRSLCNNLQVSMLAVKRINRIAALMVIIILNTDKWLDAACQQVRLQNGVGPVWLEAFGWGLKFASSMNCLTM